MPILEVEIVSDPDPETGLARKIADACAPILNANSGQVWVKLKRIPLESYAENGTDHPDKPLFVRVTKGVLQPTPELSQEAKALTEAIAQAAGWKTENVCLVYRPPAKGHIAFGGNLVE